MQLTDKIFKGLYRRGVMLEQMKEPALSRTVKQMEPAEPCENPRDIDALSPEEILRAAEEADIVDETDGRPLAEKLREAMGSGTMLLIDAIDDEPYVSSQMGPMLALRDQCAGGIRLAARALGTTDATVLVYRHISDSEVAIPRNIGGIPIKRVGGKYPAQCQMEEELAERYSGKGSWLLCGACAMIHLYRAAVEGRPQTTTFVTVAGNCVGFPRNVEAPLGTPVLELLKLCGLTERPTRVILGGPLTGTATEDLRNEKVELSTTAVLAIRDDKHEYSYTCIGCGRCTAVCPQGLNPMRILQELRRGNRRAVEELGRWIGESGHRLIYGGSKSGLMGVLADCVLNAGGEVIGVEPEFFMERAVQHTGLTRLIVTKDMSERKAKMIGLGQAFIAFPGGTGTLEEIAEIMSKVSLGQLDAPCILYNLDGYYNSLRALLDHMIEKGLSTPERQAGIRFARDLGEIRQILAEAESGR